jgi:hypothetical protein
LEAVRAAHPAESNRATRGGVDRSEALARWFGARLSIERGGATVVIERSIPLPAPTLALLGELPAATYFDTETTGLSTGAGTVIFLAGLGLVDGSRLVVHQYLLPDYHHEPAMLRQIGDVLARHPRVVTYNGRGFDLPLLTTRLTVNGLFPHLASLPAIHDDLLPAARRLWRRPLGGARLATVEREVLGVRRGSDCPSSEVPMRYFGYLRGQSPDVLAEVLDHNLQDIVSLALLEGELLRLRAGGWRDATGVDRRGMALELLRSGLADDAIALADESAHLIDDPSEATALRRLASRLRLAAGDVDGAEEIWRAGTHRASLDGALAWLEIARIRERRRGDLSGALVAASAAARALDLAFVLGRGGDIGAVGAARLRIDRRLRRLRSWVAAADRRRAAGQPAGRRYRKPGPPAQSPPSTATQRPSP